MARLPREALSRNGGWLVLVPLGISLALWSALPPAYAPENFGAGIPTWLSLSENVFRVLVFATPGALLVGASSRVQRLGWGLYSIGLALYLASYVLLAIWPDGAWAGSALGFTAPAWTPALWLIGVALICQDSWVNARWIWWLYLGPVAAFLGLHVGHAALVWSGL
ncbi:MAG: hypothetical protein ACRBN8_38770 [Nannocystales bacterium]